MTPEEALPVSRMERKKEETRQKIVATAVRLFQQYGPDAVTMEQIAAEADIAKGTLYNYYPSRDDIISDFIQRTFATRYDGRIELLRTLPDTRTRLTRILDGLLEGIHAQRDIFDRYIVFRMQNILSFQTEPAEQSGLRLLITEIVSLGQASGEIRTDMPREILEHLVEFAVMMAAKRFYIEGEQFNARQTIDQCVDMYLNGASAPSKSTLAN